MFYHIPRTGGIYVKEAMRWSGVAYTRSQTKNRTTHPFGLLREHETPAGVLESEKKSRLSFCFVRRPTAWIRSFWAYRMKTRYLDMHFPLDRIWDDDFNKFCENILARYPNGFVTKLFGYYVNGVDIVGRQENLTDDLITILRKAGQKFDETTLRLVKKYNLGASRTEIGKSCILSHKMAVRINEADKWILKKYY